MNNYVTGQKVILPAAVTSQRNASNWNSTVNNLKKFDLLKLNCYQSFRRITKTLSAAIAKPAASSCLCQCRVLLYFFD